MLTIQLDQEALEEAITDYISGTALNVDLSGKDVSIKLTIGRGGNGSRAEVQVFDSEAGIPTEDAENDVVPPTAAEPDVEDDEPAVGPFD